MFCTVLSDPQTHFWFFKCEVRWFFAKVRSKSAGSKLRCWLTLFIRKSYTPPTDRSFANVKQRTVESRKSVVRRSPDRSAVRQCTVRLGTPTEETKKENRQRHAMRRTTRKPISHSALTIAHLQGHVNQLFKASSSLGSELERSLLALFSISFRNLMVKRWNHHISSFFLTRKIRHEKESERL